MISSNAAAPIVMLATPAYGGLQPLHDLSMIETMRYLGSRGRFRTTRQFCSGNPILPYARSNLFGKFVGFRDSDGTPCEWMAMVDNDIGFPPNLIEVMIDFAECHGKTMVAAVAPKRSLDLQKIIDTGRAVEGISWPVWPEPAKLAERPVTSYSAPNPDGSITDHNFVQVDAVGTAFFLMRRSAALAMAERFPELNMIDDEGFETWSVFHPPILDKRAIMEDMAFFGRWRLMGGEIWAILDAPMTHTGPITIGASLGAAVRGEDIPIAVSASDARNWTGGKKQ